MGFRPPKETVHAMAEAGAAKAALSWGRLGCLSFLAGAYIALGGLLSIIVGCGVPGLQATNPGLQKLLFGGVFPVGLMFVIIAGAELFTGNTAVCVPAVAGGRMTGVGCARNWLVSYLGNFAGSLFVAYCLAYLTGLLANEPWHTAVVGIANAKVAQDAAPLFFKALGCNWLVCLAVWMAAASDDITGKILGIWFPIMGFVALGFEHSVANMFFVPTGMLYGAQVSWADFLLRNLVPVTLGNIVGGALFVGAAYTYVYGARAGRAG